VIKTIHDMGLERMEWLNGRFILFVLFIWQNQLEFKNKQASVTEKL